ncbi:alpha/beta hydrolase [Actinomadura luteofluorescens]
MIDLPSGPVEYRLEERGPRVVLMLHGGHMRAGLPLGEETFADAGCTVLAVSRPGYGRTPLATGAAPDQFAAVIGDLCRRLGIDSLTAVVGQSAGGPTAVTLAACRPDLVERLILESAVGLLPWPDRRTRVGASIIFHPRAEPVTWALVHSLMRHAPGLGLRLLLPDLTRRPITELVAALTTAQRAVLLDLFGRMRSGAGFANDIRTMTAPHHLDALAAHAARLRQPTLVIASRDDGAVAYDARLIPSTAPSHMIWLGDDYPAVTAAITAFLPS